MAKFLKGKTFEIKLNAVKFSLSKVLSYTVTCVIRVGGTAQVGQLFIRVYSLVYSDHQ